MQRLPPNHPDIIQAAIIIDGAYLMIGGSHEHSEVLPFLSSRAGVEALLTSFSQELMNVMQKTEKKNLPVGVARKLASAEGKGYETYINFAVRHFVCAYAISKGKRYYPERVVPEVWTDFAIGQNLHTYKHKHTKCQHCKNNTTLKVQSGVDIGVATRLSEELIEAGAGNGRDIILLVAGDNDFKDIMELCMKKTRNLFLAGFIESAHVISAPKYCVNFTDITKLVQSNMGLLPAAFAPSVDFLVKINVQQKDAKLEQFKEFLVMCQVVPKKIDWDQKILYYQSKEEANNAVGLVFMAN